MINFIFFPVRDYHYELYPLKFPTSESHTVSELANKENTILCLLFCHEKHLLNNTQNYLLCELVYCLAEKNV